MENSEKIKLKEIKNINEVMTKQQQAKKILQYLLSVLVPAKTTKARKLQKEKAKKSLIKHFPELAQFV